MTAIMSQVSYKYNDVAEACTDQENHRTKDRHRDSLILKKFSFNFIFYFTHLFYVAFEKNDIEGLRKELIILTCADEFRRIAMEVVYPYVMLKSGRTADKILEEKKLSIAEEEYEELQKGEY